jgi:argininosuccinate lyase
MDEAETIKQYLKDLIAVMANRAEKEVDILMPGYTHVQVQSFKPTPLF